MTVPSAVLPQHRGGRWLGSALSSDRSDSLGMGLAAIWNTSVEVLVVFERGLHECQPFI